MKDIYEIVTEKASKIPKVAHTNPDINLVVSEEKISDGKVQSKYILENHRTSEHTLITKREAFIWQSLIENPNVINTIVKYYYKYDKLAIDFIDSVLYLWKKKNIILPDTDMYHWIDRAITKQNRIREYLKIIQKIISIEINIPLFVNFINKFSVYFRKLIPEFIIKSTFLIAGIINLFFLNELITRSRFIEYNTKESILLIPVILLFTTLIHELAHGIALNYFGHNVSKAGIKLYFGIPVFFVDTSHAWEQIKVKRIKISLAGVMSNLIFSSLFYILYLNSQNTPQELLYFYLAFFNLLSVFINMIPFVEFDGYYVLIDLLDNPNLKNNSLKVLSNYINGKNVPDEKKNLAMFAIIYIFFITIFIVASIIINIQKFLVFL